MTRSELSQVLEALNFSDFAVREYASYPEPSYEIRQYRLNEIAAARRAVIDLYHQQETQPKKGES